MINKKLSISIMMSATLALIVGVATAPAAFAHTQRWITGYIEGAQAARQAYESGTGYYSYCPTRDDGSEHTPNYCDGYVNGYKNEWIVQWHYYHVVVPNKQTITQGSEVNIKGNGNRVVVNQQANNGAQQPISGYPVYGGGHSSNSGQNLPECRILCANIKIGGS